MKGVVVTAKNKVEVKEFGEPLFESLGQAVGGFFEIVRTTHLKLPDGVVMVVNDEGLIKRLPLNLLGSVYYGFLDHGNPIVGDIVFMKEGMTNDSPDFVPFDEDEAEQLEGLFTMCLTLFT